MKASRTAGQPPAARSAGAGKSAHRCFANTSSHLTTLPLNPILPNPLLPNPYCAPYIQPLGSTPVTPPPCHPPNLSIPSTPLSPPPSMIIHAPIWCRGRSPSTGPRAPCLLNGTNLVSYSVYATTRSGLSSTLPPGGSCGLDYTFIFVWGGERNNTDSEQTTKRWEADEHAKR